MEDTLNNNDNIPQQKKRPDTITVLCVLTFIGSGMGVFSFLILSLFYKSLSLYLNESTMTMPEMEVLLNAGIGFFVLSFVCYAVSLFGAIKMWQLKKIGFHLYTIAQLLLLLIPMIFIGKEIFSFVGLFFTLLFVGLYGINLKHME